MNWMEWEDYMLKNNLIQYKVDKMCRDSGEKICVARISDVRDVLLCCAGFFGGWSLKRSHAFLFLYCVEKYCCNRKKERERDKNTP